MNVNVFPAMLVQSVKKVSICKRCKSVKKLSTFRYYQFKLMKFSQKANLRILSNAPLRQFCSFDLKWRQVGRWPHSIRSQCTCLSLMVTLFNPSYLGHFYGTNLLQPTELQIYLYRYIDITCWLLWGTWLKQ